jgi:hypothetical protein
MVQLLCFLEGTGVVFLFVNLLDELFSCLKINNITQLRSKKK